MNRAIYYLFVIPAENLAAFLVAALIIIVIPGPSVLFAIGRSITLGRRAGVLSVLGNTLGALPALLAVAFGIGALVAKSVVAFTILKFAGALYLVYLGVQAIRHRRAGSNGSTPLPSGTIKLLRQGFVVGATNPKTMAFFVAVFPQFVDPASGPAWAQLLILGAIFLVMGVVSDSIWALAAGTARQWFASSPGRLSGLGVVGGVTMVGLGGALALTSS